VDGLLDLLVGRAEQLGRLGVEQRAVTALGLRVEGDPHEFLVLVGDEGLAEFNSLEDLPLEVQVFVWDPGEEARNEAKRLLDLSLDHGSGSCLCHTAPSCRASSGVSFQVTSWVRGTSSHHCSASLHLRCDPASWQGDS
jgi:hypothetical protein